MSTIDSGIPLYDPRARAIDLSQKKLMHISEASEEVYQSYINSSERLLEAKYTEFSSDPNSPRYQEYATVEVNGRTVATIDNNGYVKTSNGVSAALQELFASENNGLRGPALAQDRAAKIAGLLGGEVVKSSTAISQSQYNATPAPQANVDYEAMRQDPFYEQLQKTKQARTVFLAHSLGQGEGQPAGSGKVTLETSLGQKAIDIEEYFNPKPRSGPLRLDEVPLLTPSAQNINTLVQHAQGKFRDLLSSSNIPEGPSQISYDNEGNIKLPDDYQYKDELKQALEDNPALARELSTIAALTSHNVGMQGSIQGYAKITLDFDAQGKMSVNANGQPYENVGAGVKGANVAESQQASSSYDEASANQSDAVKWFRDYMEKTPEERMHEAILKEKGLTPEQFEALPPEEKLAIQKEIEAEIKKRVEQKMGVTGGAVVEA